MTAMIVFDDETPRDLVARETLLDRCFGPGRWLKSSERIRCGRLPAEELSLVARDAACAADRLVGTVRLWHVSAAGLPALLLGPLAVDRSCRGAGVGVALMRLALARASGSGHAAVLLVGDPEYHGRFGFTAEAAAGLAMPGPFERRRLLGLEIQPNALQWAAGVIRPTGKPVLEVESATLLAA